MNRRAFFPAVAFLSALFLFAFAITPFLSLSPVSLVHAQGAAPTFDSTADFTREVAENTKPYDSSGDYVMIGDPVTATGFGIIYSIENAKTAHFGINSYTGDLLVGTPPDYETEKKSYTVTIVAKNPSGTARQEVTINVTDVEEDGKVTLSWTKDGSDLKFAASLDDPDGGVTSTSWQWQTSSSSNGPWTNAGTPDMKTITANATATYLRVTATYTDARGSGKTASASLRRPVKTHGKTLKFEANSDQGYNCDKSGTITRFCVNVHQNKTPGTDIYYPASVSYSDGSYPNLGEISYSLAGRDAGSFAIDPSSRKLIATSPDGYYTPGSDGKYEVEIKATDLAGKEATVTIEAEPSGGESNPIVQGPQVIRYPENGTWQLATYTGKFHGRVLNKDVGWIVSVEPGGGDGDFFDINDDGVLSFTQPPDFEQGQEQFSFWLTAYASNGPRGSAFYRVRVIVEDVNDPPEIVGPPDVDFPENSTDAVAEYTVEGVDQGESATWTLKEGDDASEFSITKTGADSAELRFKSPPDYESFNTGDEEHIFLLTMMVDVDGDMKTEHVRVEVTNVNEPPAFPTETATRSFGENAEPEEPIGDPVEATDPDSSDYLTYTLTGTDDDTSFEILSSSGQLKTKSGVNYGSKTRYTVTVTATDQGKLTDTITVTITSTAENDAPVFDDANLVTTLTVDENTPADTNIGTAITADDEDNDSLIYTLDGTDKDSFTIDTSGQIQTKAGVTYDYETKSSYSVTVKADDSNGGTDTTDVTIDLNNVDEDGTVTLSPGQFQVGTPLTASLEDPDGTVSGDTWQWARDDNASGDFADIIANANSANYTPVEADSTKFLQAMATYTDPQGSGKSAEATTVNVVQAVPITNEAPEFPSTETGAREVAENIGAGEDIGAPVAATDANTGDTLIYSLGGTDGASFGIDTSTGQLRVGVSTTLDHETNPSYTVTVSVRDSKDATGAADTVDDDSIEVTITVTNEDEDGTVTLSPAQPQVDTPLTATLTDPDGAVSGETWEWARDASASGAFADIISGATAASYTPVAADVGKFLQATATYTDPQDSGKSANATSVNAVQAVPITNEAPEFPSTETGARSVAENTEAGEDIGAPVAAIDGNAGDTLTYSLGGTDGASFGIDTSTGQLRVGASTTLDYETKSSYTVTVSVRDSKDADGDADTAVDDTITVTITVTNEDEDGTVTLSETHPLTGTALTATLDDPDKGVTVTAWQWARADSRSGAFTDINGATGDSYTPETADLNKYLRATATYTDGEGSGKSANTVSDNAVNAAPVFSEPAATRAVDENTPTGQPIGAPVTATDADTLNYKLGGADTASFSIVETSGQLQTDAELDFEGKSSYEVTVTATDPYGATASVPVTITVNNLEEAGTVKLTLLQPQVGTAQTATLTDPDKSPSRVSWQWARGDSPTGSFTNVSSGADPGSYTPVAADLNKYLRATATYDDGHGAGKTASAVSTNAVRAAPATNSPPVFSEATASRSVPENTDVGQDIGTAVTASDAASDTLTYSLDGDDADAFDIVPASGQLQTKAPLDFEAKSSYTVVVTATDPSGALDTIAVTITVTNVDEDGTVTLSNVQPQVGTALTAMLEDPDGDSTSVTWQWGRGAASTGPFPNISSVASYTPVAADVGKFLQATATYTDPEGPGKTAHGVSVNAVQAAPDGPNSAPFFLAATASRSVAEDAITGASIGTPVKATDADNDNLTYTLSGSAAAFFGIVDTSGQLQATAALDYETTSSYTVTVTATDPSGLVGSITVTISVGNVDEPGTVSTSPVQPQVGTALTAMLTDPDGKTSDVTWQWTRADTTSAYADIGSGDTYTPDTADVGEFLQATATYTDPQGSGKSAQAVSPAVQAAPITNVAPAFPSTETGTRTVAENTEAGENIGAPIAADDANTGDTLTYSLEGTDAASFDIDSSTGQLKTKDALDHETKDSYTVTVKADDSNGGTDTITVTINVTDVNEPPTFDETGPATRTVSENTGAGENIGLAFTATDPDVDASLTYVLGGTDAASFTIATTPDGKGQLKTVAPLDHETKDSYSIVVGVRRQPR